MCSSGVFISVLAVFDLVVNGNVVDVAQSTRALDFSS